MIETVKSDFSILGRVKEALLFVPQMADSWYDDGGGMEEFQKGRIHKLCNGL